MDIDNNRCVVRMALGSNARSVSMYKCRLVTNEEYDKNSKVISAYL